MLSQQAQAEMTYQRHLADLQDWVGWFALIRGEKLGGIFPTYETAATAWMGLYGPVPALIRRIERNSSVATVTEPVQGMNPARYVQTITPADAEARLAVCSSWAVADGRRNGNQEYAA